MFLCCLEAVADIIFVATDGRINYFVNCVNLSANKANDVWQVGVSFGSKKAW